MERGLIIDPPLRERRGGLGGEVKRVVIVGGGFAGLYAARGLAGSPVEITVIDRSNHHLFQPMLYQVATAALSPGDIASPIRSILRRQQNAEVILGDVVNVDPHGRSVRLANSSRYVYDYLILSCGARHSYFGHDEWEALAPGLKRVEDALEVRRRVLLAFERAEREADPEARHAELTFVVVGAGPTGVEVAGALAELSRYALRRDFRHIDSREARILLLEGGPEVLSSYPESLRRAARKTLEDLGIELHTSTLVTGLSPTSVVAGERTFAARTVIWAAGNHASPLLDFGAELDRQGRVVVRPDLSVPAHPEILVLGDAAAFTDPDSGAPLPAVAPVAIQMGKHAARVINADLNQKKRKPFRYRDKGQLAVIGRGRAVADLGRLHFGGFVAWLIWIFVHIAYLIGFRNRLIVLIEWGWSYLTFQRGARLITGIFAGRRPETT